MNPTPTLYIVVPCYNEEEVLPETARRLSELMDSLISFGEVTPESRVLFVDDGSRDATWNIIESFEDPRFEGAKLAHNAGHQNALWAGMTLACDQCDAVISIDADLQDDPEAIHGFLDAYREGCDVVYGVRKSRETDTAFKRLTAEGFYKLMRLFGAEIVDNHADYRLLSHRALEALLRFGEVNLFLRGMVPLLGFSSKKVYYDRAERFAGESKYPLKKMLGFAMEGITSFSVKPIRMITVLGVLFALLGAIFGIYALVSLCTGHAVAGWTSLIMSIWLIGGVNLIALGLIGEYIGKIYLETKGRPRFLIESYIKPSGAEEEDAEE